MTTLVAGGSATRTGSRPDEFVSDDFYYDLPPELIAQEPVRPRDHAAMLVLDPATSQRVQRQVRDLPDFLRAGDVVVVNDTKVVPTVLRGRRPGGGQVVIRMVSRKDTRRWDCAVDSTRALSVGDRLEFGDGELSAVVERRNDEDTGYHLRFAASSGDLRAAIARQGRYFHPLHLPALKAGDEEILQTVYAEHDGSFQSPSAGLHVTEELVARLRAKGVAVVSITQHVGRLDNPGPLAGPSLHAVERLYEEWFELPPQAAEVINAAHRDGGRVVAIGTTVTRTLETRANADGSVTAGTGWTTLFIKPGHRFRVVDVLLSNFQSPRITTLVLACAFAGTDAVMEHYREAVRRRLRFLEYGDAALYLGRQG